MASTMDCAQLREILLRGELPGEAADAHCAACPACAELLADDAALARVLEPEAAELPEPPSELLNGLQARLAEEEGAGAWLRSRPTWLRRLFVLLLVLALPASAFVPAGLHPELPGPAHLAAELALLGITALLAAWTALRPLHRAPVAPGVLGGLLAACLAVPFAAALVRAHASAAPEPWAEALDHATGCFRSACLYAIPLGILLWQVLRSASLGRLLLGGAGAGLSGLLVMQLRCPMGSWQHHLLGHATVTLACVLVVLAAWTARRARDR